MEQRQKDAGKDAKAAADAAAKLDGVAKVLLVEGAAYEHALAEPIAALIVSLAGSYDSLVAPATTNGKNVMPRVAALLDVMLQVTRQIRQLGPLGVAPTGLHGNLRPTNILFNDRGEVILTDLATPAVRRVFGVRWSPSIRWQATFLAHSTALSPAI